MSNTKGNEQTFGTSRVWAMDEVSTHEDGSEWRVTALLGASLTTNPKYPYRVRMVCTKSQAKRPSIATMTRWSMDGVAKATDGCRVEPDGVCPHGKQSWLLVLGYI